MDTFDNLHQALRVLYTEMIPLCSDMTGIAKAIAGLGALFYVSYRVWQSLARAEPIDVYPLLRPFAIGLCILFFPTLILGTMNAVLSPIVRGTNAMLETQVLDMEQLKRDKDQIEREMMLRNPDEAFLVSDEAFDKAIDELGWGPKDLVTMGGMYAQRSWYQMKKSIQQAFMNFLELIFNAAALIIDCLRTFFLIVLSILGPIAFAFSIYDGFQSTLTTWLTRYISIYLWLPVADIFSTILAKLQALMLQKDIAEMAADPNYIPQGTNGIYITFMLIGIVGYFTIPSVAGWIVQAGGMGSYGKNVNSAAVKGTSVAGGAMGAASGNILGRIKG
jgi:conjugative transposon TraJ protein